MPGFIEGLSEREYFSDKLFVTRSMLSDILQSPMIFAAKHLFQSIADDGTESTKLGSALHVLALDGEESFAKKYAVLSEKIDRRTKAGKEAWEAFLIANASKEFLSREQHDLVRAMFHTLDYNATVDELLGGKDWTERVIWWDDPKTGIPCKAKLDGLAYGQVVFDLKTSATPRLSEFSRSIASYGYHQQAAHYLRGARAVGIQHPKFVFIVVGNQPPHEVFVYELESDAIMAGEQQLDLALARLSDCLIQGDHATWEHPDSTGVITIGLPRWAMRFVERKDSHDGNRTCSFGIRRGRSCRSFAGKCRDRAGGRPDRGRCRGDGSDGSAGSHDVGSAMSPE